MSRNGTRPVRVKGRRARRLAMANQSGGSCKTTSATAVATHAAKRGLKVLFIDCDSQMNGFLTFGGEGVPEDAPTIADVMNGEIELANTIVPAMYKTKDGDFEEIPNLFMVPGSHAMADADAVLTLDAAGTFWLQSAVDSVAEDYDVIICDCPGSLGRLMISILVAFEEIVCCVKPGYKELEAVTELEKSIATVVEKFKRFKVTTRLAYILVGDAPTTRSQGAVYDNAQQEARQVYGEMVLPTTIRRDVRVPEAYKDRQPLPIYDPASGIAQDYGKCTTELRLVA